jgi:hypothetical protein
METDKCTIRSWSNSLVIKIWSKAPPVRFEQIDAAIVITIDQISLAIEFFHKWLMLLNASHV